MNVDVLVGASEPMSILSKDSRAARRNGTGLYTFSTRMYNFFLAGLQARASEWEARVTMGAVIHFERETDFGTIYQEESGKC